MLSVVCWGYKYLQAHFTDVSYTPTWVFALSVFCYGCGRPDCQTGSSKAPTPFLCGGKVLQINNPLRVFGGKRIVKMSLSIINDSIREFHLFAGIGGGIYGGSLLGHTCCAGVEIDKYCQNVLRQRQLDGWMNSFPIYEDIKELNGKDFENTFDILCGGFPCQAFSYAAHGNNIEEKNLWPEMFRFVKESDAPIVFGENVIIEAIDIAKQDLESIGYKVERCRVACMDLDADHKRPRFWLLAMKDNKVFNKVAKHISSLPRLKADFWKVDPNSIVYPSPVPVLAPQKKGIGNAQAPIAAAVAFRVLVNRHLNHQFNSEVVNPEEVDAVFERCVTWIKSQNPNDPIFVHTPTTMGNYHYKSMQKHPSCAKYVRIFGKPTALHAEYLMGFPIGASSPFPQTINNYKLWITQTFRKD